MVNYEQGFILGTFQLIRSHMLTVHTEGTLYLKPQNRTRYPETKQGTDSMYNRHVSFYKYYSFSFHIKLCQWVAGFFFRCKVARAWS